MNSVSGRKKSKKKPSSKKPYVIGIDPGLSGAIAVLDTTPCPKRPPDILATYSMPTFSLPSVKNPSKTSRHLDSFQLNRIIALYSSHIDVCAIENPHSMPNQGLASTFKFGRICGLINGILVAHEIPTVQLDPAAWKMALGLSRDKQTSIDLARKIFQADADLFKLKKDNDVAEAVLMAYLVIKHHYKCP